jgi:Ca2+-binding RTX toxin-like protein
MAVVQNTSASNITALDFSSTSTSALTLTGDSTDNTLIGGAGNDTATTGTGSDTVLTWGGDDSITINGSGNKTIDGGAGTDSLSITYSGISGLDGFTVSSSGSTISLTDSSNNVINYSGIENLSVNSKSYTYINNGAINSGDGGISNAYWGATDSQIISAGSTVWYAQNIGTAFSGLSASDNLAYIGSASGETVNLNIDRSSTYTGNLTMTLGDGSDSILSAKIKNDDSINMGAGDDTMYVMVSGSNGTPSLSSLNMTLLDGGTGTDTLAFEESTVANGTTLNLTTGGATNFENLRGSASNETLNGDANANVLSGVGGNDTLNGLGGNDILYANAANGGAASSDSGTDNLYGGAGDDQLFGSAGENILDGGAGSDTLTGGNGSDTFVVRAADSGSDTITDFTSDDVLGLVDGLALADISTTVNGSNTEIYASSNLLVTLENYTSTLVAGDDYVVYEL